MLWNVSLILSKGYEMDLVTTLYITYKEKMNHKYLILVYYLREENPFLIYPGGMN